VRVYLMLDLVGETLKYVTCEGFRIQFPSSQTDIVYTWLDCRLKEGWYTAYLLVLYLRRSWRRQEPGGHVCFRRVVATCLDGEQCVLCLFLALEDRSSKRTITICRHIQPQGRGGRIRILRKLDASHGPSSALSSYAPQRRSSSQISTRGYLDVDAAAFFTHLALFSVTSNAIGHSFVFYPACCKPNTTVIPWHKEL
jgi:hypothetical protein